MVDEFSAILIGVAVGSSEGRKEWIVPARFRSRAGTLRSARVWWKRLAHTGGRAGGGRARCGIPSTAHGRIASICGTWLGVTSHAGRGVARLWAEMARLDRTSAKACLDMPANRHAG